MKKYPSPSPAVVTSCPMIEDDMTPAERARFEADLAHDLPDLVEALHGLPKTIPDLTAAIADLAERITYKRRELVELLKWEAKSPAKDLPAGEALPVRKDPDHVGALRREISRLEARRNDYLDQLSQKN